MVDLVRERVGPAIVVEAAHMELARPSIEDGLQACVAAGAREIVVHPYLLAPGRHASEDLPRRVGEVAARLGVPVRVTDPLGVHPLLAEVVLERCGLGRDATGGSASDPNDR